MPLINTTPYSVVSQMLPEPEATYFKTHFEGVNAGIVFTPVSGSNGIRSGNAITSTEQKKFGASSLKVNNGTPDGADAVRFTVDNNAFRPKTAFTAECWVYPTTLSNLGGILGQWAVANNAASSWAVLKTGGGAVAFIFAEGGAVPLSVTSSSSLTLNQWQHLAVSWDGLTARIFFNGNMVASAAYSGQPNIPTHPITIGCYNSVVGQTPYAFSGYIDEVRITNGYAHYTGNFTPPTTPF